MNPELKAVSDQLKKAKCPEDVFGKILSEKDGTKTYHRLAKVVHADKYTDKKDKKLADEAFVNLKKWWEQAKAKLANKTYGNKKAVADTSIPKAITIQSKKAVYVVTDIHASGDLSDIFKAEFSGKAGTERVLIKVVRSPKNNDLMTAERTALDALSKVKQAEHRVPTLIEAITVQDVTNTKRSAHVFAIGKDDLISLDAIFDAFGMDHPIDPAHVAWMGSRLWTNLGVFHSAGLVHGAIHPGHCLICAENHGMVIVDWCYSVKIGETIKAISPRWKALYPKEVFDKKPATQATDIYMGAFMLTIALGGVTNNPHNPWFPASVPLPMQAFLRSCLLPAQHRRPQDAIELADDWKKMLSKVFGKPKFIPFNIPAKAGAA